MININLNNELSRAIENMALHQHQPVEKIINDALIEKLEDYRDIKAAEQMLEEIDSGLEELIPWEQVKAELNDVDKKISRQGIARKP